MPRQGGGGRVNRGLVGGQMIVRWLRSLRMLVVVAAALAFVPTALAAPKQEPVPSLTPKATQKLWKQLVSHPRTFSATAAADCRPVRVVFYTESDWLRLATKLAANASPCAQYYISVPPLAADKTKFRYDQPWRIRALGPNFHVLAEINFTGWSNWVTANNSTFYDAGLEARRRMAASGFDVPSGDTWAMNELNSAVRRNVGVARTKARDLLRGLYTGDGTVPSVRGVAFNIGIDQSPHKVSLQDWYNDAPFWQDMSAYVSDWSQELYGDVRDYGVPGSSAQDRAAHLNDYLGHQLALATAAPDSAATAKSFIASASTPLANAAWIWTAGFGYTSVPVAQMQDFVSGQVYALRSLDAQLGLSEDRIGFAWAPRNTDGAAWTSDYVAQSGQVLDRLAVAIRDSADSPDLACGPTGQNLWCSAAVDGAAFTESWKTFATWSPPALGFASAPVTVNAGDASAPITVQLQTDGVADPDANPVVVTLASSSPQGGFSASPSGPWTSTFDVTIPAASTTGPAVYYRDTKAGPVTLTATASGRQSGSQAATVSGSALASLSVSPTTATVGFGGSQTLTATGYDAFGNTVAASPTWTLGAGAPGTLSATTGPSVTFTAGSTAGNATVTVAAGAATASATITVKASPLQVTSIAYRLTNGRLAVTTTVANAATGAPVPGASVSLAINRGSSFYASGSGTTGSDGRLTVTTSSRVPSGCYRTAMKSVTAPGFAWDGVTPANQYCR
jgi:hypothetical protein